ncbi:RND family efflux transporter, MFP subunit [Chitinophaga costaii]|uniref:RND family efflux transporter, MFP subunit n=1 Tax=Chitinophaga costaii TaxID=1335309 RepID=A0A1C4CB70_9BACT|nr:efflux RND transporter periplasmic adaptor subunit [Chitinophaga costaii]PUZ27161.1 efflux RND transporter periplasmic adaptor subunit [Chitinophaga costaii]SCC16288.1 RND family efflux transporter, MFP subunit [Chitinophaga costaii]
MKQLFFYGLPAIVLLVSCGGAAPAKEETIVRTPVKTAAVEQRQYVAPIVSSGTIGSDKEARLSFKTGGVIAQLHVDEGDAVHAGQLLGTLNITEIHAQAMQAQQSFDKAMRRQKRTENLYNDSTATREELENSQTDVDIAQQALHIARFNEQYAAIYANQSGRVLHKMMNTGEVAAPGQTVYVINSTNASDWVIRSGVADRDWARLAVGDTATLQLDAYPGKTWKAILTERGEEADPATGTFPIKLKVLPGDFTLANGLTAKISIYPSHAVPLFFIPVAAITEVNHTTAYVYTINADGKSVTRHAVNISCQLKDAVGVDKGLENISRVVTDGASFLRENSFVTEMH